MMFRGIIPFILASLGVILFSSAINTPLFEWHVSEIATDSPYEVRFNSSPWTANFGDSLEDSAYIFRQFDTSYCKNSHDPENLNSVVRRSWSEETLERITQNINHSIIPGLLLLLFPCGIYMWWYTIHYKRSFAEAVAVNFIAMVILIVLLNARLFYYIIGLGCLEGTVTFNAKLSKIHYEALLILFAAILAEVGAISIMLHQIRAARKKDEFSKSVVG